MAGLGGVAAGLALRGSALALSSLVKDSYLFGPRAAAMMNPAAVDALATIGAEGALLAGGVPHLPSVSGIGYVDELASIPVASAGERLIILGQYRIELNGRVLAGFDKSLDRVASSLGGRTLREADHWEQMKEGILSADRILFFTSSNIGNDFTRREMNLIQSTDVSRKKTTFMLGFYPE